MAEGGWRSRSFFLCFLALTMSCAPPSPVPPAASPPVPGPAPVTVEQPTRSIPRVGVVSGGAGFLQYRIEGDGPDTVVVPLASWLFPALRDLGRNRLVIFYDPRHRGQSHAMVDSTAATFDGDVADLDSVRKAVGASRVAVIGYDYYAAVAAAWAAEHPRNVSRLVLLSPIEPTDSIAMMWDPPERMVRLDTTAARALVKARAAGRDTADAARYCEDFWRVNASLFVGDTARAANVRPDWCQFPNESPARIAAASGRALASSGPAVDFGARGRGVTAPTLVMHGRQDLVANPEGARAWARGIDGARLLWLSNIGHLPFLEDRAAVVETIAEFLDGRWPVRAGPP